MFSRRFLHTSAYLVFYFVLEWVTWTGSLSIAAGICLIFRLLTNLEMLYSLADQKCGRDSSVSKSSASQPGDSGSNPSGSLTQVTQCMNERGRDITNCKSHIASFSLTDWCIMIKKKKKVFNILKRPQLTYITDLKSRSVYRPYQNSPYFNTDYSLCSPDSNASYIDTESWLN